MEPLTAMMILIGCSGPATCQQVTAPQPAYHSVESCEQELQGAIVHATRDRTQVYGTCADVGQAIERDASVTWDLSRDGRIRVSVVDGDARYQQARAVVASR